MKALDAAGVDAFCTKGLTKHKVAICHQYGILVRTSANNLQAGQPPDSCLGNSESPPDAGANENRGHDM